MDICLDKQPLSVYKVKVWNDPNNVVVYIFVGSQPPDVQQALSAIEQKSKLSPESASVLSKQFGISYKAKLGVDESCKVKMIYQTLYRDDTVGMVRKKISTYLSEDEDVYMWINRSILNLQLWSTSIGIQLMRGKSRIRKSDFLSRMRDLRGMHSGSQKKAAKDEDEELDLDDVIDVIMTCKMTSYAMPLEFKRVIDGYVLPGFVNPFEFSPNDFQKLDEADRVYESGNLLESFVIAKNTINIVRKSNIKSEIHPFFFNTKSLINPSDAQVIKSADTLHRLYQEQSNIDRNKDVVLNMDCSISFLHLRFNESIEVPRIALGEVFARLQTGQPFLKKPRLEMKKLTEQSSIILIKHNVAGQKQYKLQKGAISTVATSSLNNWTEMSTTGRKASSGKTEYIMIKGLYDVNRYLTFILFADYHVDVKFIGSKAENLRYADINSTGLQCIHDIVQHIRERVPEIRNRFFDVPKLSLLKIVNLVSHIRVETSVKKVGLRELKTFAGAMFPFISIDTSNEMENVLMMMYKRINNYANNSNITVFLNKNYKQPDTELVKNLVDTFCVSNDVATTEVAKWRKTSKMAYYQVGHKLFLRPKDYNNISITISKTINGYDVLVDGVTDIVYHQRIANLIRFLVLNAADENVNKTFIKSLGKTSFDKIAFDSQTDGDSEEDEITMNDAISISFSMDEDDIEDDFNELFQIDITDDDADMVGGADDDGSNTDKTKTYVLKELQRADPIHFGNPYSKHCQAVNLRQPVVIDDDIKAQIDERFPGSYKNYTVRGTHAGTKKRNIFICPEIWCPVSKISMSFKQFVENGERCPLLDEEPHNFTDAYYGKEKKMATQKTRYVGYTKGPECYPCCFIINQQRGAKRDKFLNCDNEAQPQVQPQALPQVQPQAQPQVQPQAQPQEQIHAPLPLQDASVRYILGTQYPLDAGRLGLLPKNVEQIFGNMVCGSGSKSTGFVTDATDCFLRKGVNSSSQSYFLSCVGMIFGKTQNEILDAMKSNMDENMFLSLNGGKLCGQFVDKTRSIHDEKECKNFMSWLMNPKTKTTFKMDNALIELLNFLDLGKKSSKMLLNTKFDDIDASFQSSTLRLYVVYNAFSSFQAYLNDARSSKVDDVLLDIVNRKTVWLNPKGINVVVIEASRDNAYLLCNHNIENTRRDHPYVFIVKQPSYIYEPIVRVTSGVKQQMLFEIDDHPTLNDIIRAYETSCGSNLKLKGANAYAIYTYLYSIKKPVRFQVLDYDLMLVGFVLQRSSDSLFVPLRKQSPILDKPINCIYVSDIIRFVPETLGNWESAANTFRELYTLSKDSTYDVDVVYTNDRQPLAFVNKDGNTIPLSQKDFPQDMYLDNLNIFIGLQKPDARTTIVNNIQSKEAVMQALKNAVVQAFAKNDDFSNLLEDRNVEKLQNLVSKLVKNLTIEDTGIIQGPITPPCATRRKAACTGICILDNNNQCKIKVMPNILEQFQGRIIDILLKGRDTLAYPLGRPALSATDEIFFDQEDVNNGTLERLIARIKNPYAFLDKVLEEVVETRVQLYPIQKEIFLQNWKDLPSPFNKDIKNFHIDVRDPPERDLVLILANTVSTLKNYRAPFDRDSMFVIMKNNYIDMHKRQGIKAVVENLSGNSSFAYIWKNRTPTTLDEIFTVLRSANYWHGNNELQLLANALNVHFILFARLTKRNPLRTQKISSSFKTDDYVFLWWTEVKDDSGKKTQYDSYQIMTNKGLSKVLWNASEVPDIIEYISPKNLFLQQL